ncbi:MAG TPA: outer membrane beta-barrel protein [Acidiferrobacteraceae bacterium]|nr:outer membrane beta-barrel protein [Acidiferrobacteraceae bacterium]
MHKLLPFSYALALALVPAVSYAAAPTLNDVLGASGISVSGFVDSSFSYLSGSGLFQGGVADRVFDYQHDSFNLNNVDLKVQSTATSGAGGVVEVNAGQDANVFQSYPYAGTTHKFDVQQAYLQYIAGPVTFMAGKFDTLAGAEVIDSSGDVNFSRSILFGYAIPFTHTGVRATYALNSSTSFTVGVNNGWDQVVAETSPKTLELGVSATPVKPLTLTASYYTGQEYVGEPAALGSFGTSATGNRKLLDVVATYTIISPLSVTLNYDTATQDNYDGAGDKAKWSGLAAYVTYQFAPTWRLDVRGEYFKDPQGYRTGVDVGTGGQKWKEGTVTVAYLPNASMELRGEVREDKSNVAAFGTTSGGFKDTQHSVALEALYKF